ncbi:MAG: cytochrome c3 family protein [Leptospirales bacterium]
MKGKALKIGIPIFLLGGLIWAMMGNYPYAQIGYGPKQPVEYSHKKHAGDFNMDCQYCHTGVTTGKKAGVPSINICMNCHVSVGFKEDMFTPLDKLQPLHDKWDAGESPQWVRIHNMPDHVRFSHAPHVNSLSKPGEPTKEVCKTCHGDVASMEVVEQVESLNMGFCVSCHKEKRETHDTRMNCSTCHY